MVPSISLTLRATSVGRGNLQMEADLDLLRKVPDMDLNLKLEDVHLPALNDFLRAYASVDADSGTFYLYAEIVVKAAQLSGYLKPMMTNVSLADWGGRVSETTDQSCRQLKSF